MEKLENLIGEIFIRKNDPDGIKFILESVNVDYVVLDVYSEESEEGVNAFEPISIDLFRSNYILFE